MHSAHQPLQRDNYGEKIPHSDDEAGSLRRQILNVERKHCNLPCTEVYNSRLARNNTKLRG